MFNGFSGQRVEGTVVEVATFLRWVKLELIISNRFGAICSFLDCRMMYRRLHWAKFKTLEAGVCSSDNTGPGTSFIAFLMPTKFTKTAARSLGSMKKNQPPFLRKTNSLAFATTPAWPLQVVPGQAGGGSFKLETLIAYRAEHRLCL